MHNDISLGTVACARGAGRCLRRLKNNNTGGGDGVVGELLNGRFIATVVFGYLA